jgi:hypothetical protein
MSLNENTVKIILAIIALFVGLVITIKIIRKKSVNKVNQKNINAGGDVVGRDKIVKN